MAFLRSILPVLLAALLFVAPAAHSQEIFSAPAPTTVASWDVPPLPEDWDTVHAPFLRVHGHPDDYRTLLHLSRHASESLPRLALELGVPIGDTIHVVVVPSHATFRELQPGNAPSWADGVAYPALGWIYLHAPGARDNTGTPLEKVLDHELIHVVLGRSFFPNPTPMWLQEGVAKVYAKEVSPANTQAMARGMVGGGLISLTSLNDSFPRDPGRAQLAYAQSADFIGFLNTEYGEQAVPTMINHLVRGESIDAAVFAATGQWLETVDENWRSRLEDGFSLSWTALTVDGVLLGLGGIALFFGGIVRRRQFHRRLAEMEADEALVDDLVAQMRAEEAEQAIAREWKVMTATPDPWDAYDA